MGVEPAIGAKITTEDTDVGWLNMKIAVKISDVTMQLFPDRMAARF